MSAYQHPTSYIDVKAQYALRKEYEAKQVTAEDKQEYVRHQINITNKWVNDAQYSVDNMMYNETLSSPLLANCGEWEMAIERFDLDSSLVPMYVVRPLPNDDTYANTDWTKSNLCFTLSYGGVNYTQYLHVIRRDMVNSIPNVPPLNGKWPLSPLYHVYYVKHLMSMFNEALEAAYNGLAAATTLPAGASKPFITYNGGSRTWSFMFPITYYTDNLATPIELHMNNTLNAMFSNLDVELKPNDPATHLECHLIVPNRIEDITNIAGADYNEVEQPYPNIYSLCDYRYLEVTTSAIPVEVETRNVQDLGTEIRTSVTKINIAALIDFEAILSDITSVRSSSWVYLSKGKPNWIGMNKKPFLNDIDLRFYLKNSEGDRIPFKLHTNTHSTVKLVFRKKKYL